MTRKQKVLTALLLLFIWSIVGGILLFEKPPTTLAQGPTYILVVPRVIIDTQSLALAGVTIDTTPTPTSGVHEVQVQFKAGTVVGTYTTCTVQAKTAFDGTNYLTLGSAAAVAITTGTGSAWTVIEQAGTTSVTTSAVSTSVALGFGQLTKFTIACSGAYGTSAPTVVSIVARP